jgi:hypothetical protein
MKILYDEILLRFPEIRPRFSEGDEELPHLCMINLAQWLADMPKEAITSQLTDRLVSFTNGVASSRRERMPVTI